MPQTRRFDTEVFCTKLFADASMWLPVFLALSITHNFSRTTVDYLGGSKETAMVIFPPGGVLSQHFVVMIDGSSTGNKLTVCEITAEDGKQIAGHGTACQNDEHV